MPVLMIYERKSDRDKAPILVVSGGKWMWLSSQKKLIVYFEGEVDDFPCEEMESTETNMIFLAFGKK